MSLEYVAVVMNHSKAAGTDKLVLLGIANHADPDGVAYPGVPRLARYANVQQRAVQKCLRRLVDAGELVRDVQQGGDRTYDDHLRPNRYVVTVECPEGCDRSPQHKPLPGWCFDFDLGEYVRQVDDVDQLDEGPAGEISTGDTPETHDRATRRKHRVSARTPGVRTDRGGDVRTDTQTVNINHQRAAAVSAQPHLRGPAELREISTATPTYRQARQALRAGAGQVDDDDQAHGAT